MPDQRNSPFFATVTEALNSYNIYRLKDLANLVSKPPHPARKEQLVDFIQSYLEGQKLQVLWQELDELQQAAISEVVHSKNHRFPVERFAAKYGAEPDWTERSVGSFGYHATPTKLCLFFYQDLDGCDVWLPDDLKGRLKAFVPTPVPLKLETIDALPDFWQRPVNTPGIIVSSGKVEKMPIEVEDVPLEIRLRERAALHDLFAILRLVSAGKVTVSETTRYPSAATLKAIAPSLADGDYYDDENIGAIQSFAWCLLLQGTGLVEGQKLKLTPTGQKALSEPTQKTLRQMWNKWLKTKIIDELRRINGIKGQTGKGQRSLTAVAQRREVIADGLKDCPVGKWIAASEFFRYLQAAGYDFQVTRNPDSLSTDSSSFENLGYYEGTYRWGTFQGRYALCLLFEYAATLGMLDVAYVPPGKAKPNWGTYFDSRFFSRYDGLIYFRLTPLGAYCLGLSDDYSPTVPQARSQVRVLPNLEVVAAGDPLAQGEVLMLDLYAEKVSDAVWRLTRQQLLDAHAQGHSIDELERFLGRLSGEPLPETVKQLLADIQARANSLTKRGTAILIDCADPALAALIANDSRTKKYCLLAGERSLVVPIEAETKFRNALQKLGYSLPK
jgi:Helicase conserved C-terminal domain